MARQVHTRELLSFLLVSFLGTFAGQLVKAETAIESYSETRSILLLSFFASSYVLGRGIAALVSGKIFDVRPKKAKIVMLISFVFMGLISLLYALLDVPFYAILRLMSGIFAGFAWPIVQSMLLSISGEHEKSTNMSLYFVSGGIGSIVAYTVVGFLKGIFNILLAALLFMVAPMLIFCHKIKREEKSQKKRHALDQNMQVSVLTLGILSVELGLISAMLATDLIVGLLMSKGFTRTALSIILSTASTLGMIIGFPLSLVLARIGDVRGSKKIIIALSAIFLISAFVFIESTLTILLVLSISAIKIVQLSFRPILTALAKTSKTTGIRVGIVNSVHNISTMVLSIDIGYLLEIQAVRCINILTVAIFLCILVSSKNWK